MVAVAKGGSGPRYATAVCVMYWLLLSFPLTLALASLVTALATILLYLKMLLRGRDSLARLTCRESPLSYYVTNRCHTFRQALQLPVWLRNRHLQTLLGVWGSEPGVHFDRKYLQLCDGGVVALDWEEGGEYLPHGAPLLLVLPDLPQSAVQLGALCREAFNRGLKAVVVNRRGQGNSPLNTPKLPGYGDASDLRSVVDFLREEDITLSAVGVGTGGDLLLSYLGQYGSSAHLRSAVCVSPSYCAESTLHNLAFPYSCLYLSHLKRDVLRHSAIFGEAAAKTRRAWSMKEFHQRLHCRQDQKTKQKEDQDVLQESLEEKATHCRNEKEALNPHSLEGPGEEGREGVDQTEGGAERGADVDGAGSGLHGSLQEFWADNEPLRDADDIQVPVLCVSSMDDPVTPARLIQHELFRALPHFFLLTQQHGGHAGFRAALHGASWAEHAALDFVLAMMDLPPQHLHRSAPPCQHAATQTHSHQLGDYQCRAQDHELEDYECHAPDQAAHCSLTGECRDLSAGEEGPRHHHHYHSSQDKQGNYDNDFDDQLYANDFHEQLYCNGFQDQLYDNDFDDQLYETEFQEEASTDSHSHTPFLWHKTSDFHSTADSSFADRCLDVICSELPQCLDVLTSCGQVEKQTRFPNEAHG